MNLDNNNIATPISLSKIIYHPPLTKSLKYPTSNYLKTKQLYPKSTIPPYKQYSLFSNKRFTNSEISSNSLSKNVSNMSHMDYHNKSNNKIIREYGHKPHKNVKYQYRKEKSNNNIENDIDMMKLQTSCDIITRKINQIKDKVQNLHEASIEDDKNLINKKMSTDTYKKRSSNNLSFKNSISSNIDSLLNNNDFKDNKRHVFMDFSKLKNKKFLRISNKMSKEINDTFTKNELTFNDNTFRLMENKVKEFDLGKDDLSFTNKQLPKRNKLKYLSLLTQNNENDIAYNNNINQNINSVNDIENFSYPINLKNFRDIKIPKDTATIESYNDKSKKKSNNVLFNETNNKNYFKYFRTEDNNKTFNKNIQLANKYKKEGGVTDNNKGKINRFSIPYNKKINYFKLANQKFGTLDNYFTNKDYNIRDINNNKRKNNLYNDNNQYVSLQLNKNTKVENKKIRNNKNIQKQKKYNNIINIEKTNDDKYENKYLLYSNLEQNRQTNLKLNKLIKERLNNNNYIKINRNKEKSKLTIKDLETYKNTNIVDNNNINKNEENKINTNEPISYAYLIDEKLKKSINNNKDKNININNNSNNNNYIIQSQNINNNNNKHNDNIKDNKFKININNISNYSIKNNCLNINNSLVQNKKKENKNDIKDNNDKIIDGSNKKEIKLNHNYSKDDLILNTEKNYLEQISENEEWNKTENNSNLNISNNIIKKNLTFDKEEIVLDSEEDNSNKNKRVKIKRRKNILMIPNRKRNKKDDKIVRARHKELCHKFTDNPQHFFTVKLNELMLKALNINNKEKNWKK